MAGITTERPILYHTLPDLSTPHPLFERLHLKICFASPLFCHCLSDSRISLASKDRSFWAGW